MKRTGKTRKALVPMFDLGIASVSERDGTRWVILTNGSALLWIDAELRERIVAAHIARKAQAAQAKK